VAVVSTSNDAVGEKITMENIAELPWVMTYQTRSASTSAERQIMQLGVEPRVDVVVESFQSLPHFVVGTNRIALIQAALIPFALRVGGVRILPLPFDATPLVNALWWHPVHSRDSEHEWMRGLFKEAADIVAAAAAKDVPKAPA
jgi:DNA-binding transcriptional LysR family regulator